MEKIDTNIIFVDDDLKFQDDPAIEEAKELFANVKFISDSNEALKYVQRHIDEKMIIVLDMHFTSNMPNGQETLKQIRDLTHLIPVIIWSGNDVEKNELTDLFENRAFSFVSKTSSIEELIDTLIKANESFKEDVSYAIEEWIKVHPEESLEKPFITSSEGITYTLSDILKEIRLQTPMGIELSQKINKLTIDLLMRNKEIL